MLECGVLIAKAGIPDGVVDIVTGHGDPCGRALTSHLLVARISFTGGPNAARHVIGNSRYNFAEVSLELGGKSPITVFEDADIDSAVNRAVSDIFGAYGQSCVAESRLLLHEDIADDFIAKMQAIARNIKLGNPLLENTEMGPLCTTGQLETIEAELAIAVAEGATVVSGSQRADAGTEMFFQPTILYRPSPNLRIIDTELFGPVVAVLRFKDEADAIRLANHSEYGLAAGIFTRWGARSHRDAKAVKAKIIWINTCRAVSPIAEFGGMKSSGFGR